MNDENKDHPKEPNLYKGTLHTCYASTLPSCKDTVHRGVGNPAQDIASSIQNGGWECKAADDWVRELLEHTKGVMGAFDDAHTVVRNAWHAEPEQVPEHDWRGYSWSRTWAKRDVLRGPI